MPSRISWVFALVLSAALLSGCMEKPGADNARDAFLRDLDKKVARQIRVVNVAVVDGVDLTPKSDWFSFEVKRYQLNYNVTVRLVESGWSGYFPKIGQEIDYLVNPMLFQFTAGKPQDPKDREKYYEAGTEITLRSQAVFEKAGSEWKYKGFWGDAR